MSVIAPETRVVAKEVIPALGALTAFLFAWGCIKMLDGFVRALFGTVEGAVGWIPFAGRVVKRPIHKIEQKISYALGSAERKIDAHIATSFHKLAAAVRQIPGDLLDQAKLLLGLTILFGYLPTKALVLKMIRAATHPLRAKDAILGREQAHAKAQTKALHKSVAQGVYPRLKAGEVYDRTVTRPATRTIRAEARAAEAEALRLFKWLAKHRLGVAAGVFTGAVAFALGRLGGGWIRCANWRKLGRTVCRLPSPIVDAMIAALLAEVIFTHLDTLLEYVGGAMDEVTRDLYRAFGLGDLPSGRFTVE